MQVEVDVKCMQTKFGGCGNFGVTHSYFSKKNARVLKGKTDQFAPQIRLKKLDACKAYINVCVHEV